MREKEKFDSKQLNTSPNNIIDGLIYTPKIRDTIWDNQKERKPLMCSGCPNINICEGCSPERVEYRKSICPSLCIDCISHFENPDVIRKGYESWIKKKELVDSKRWKRIKEKVIKELICDTKIWNTRKEEATDRANKKDEGLTEQELLKRIQESLNKELDHMVTRNFGFDDDASYFNLFYYNDEEIAFFLVKFYKLLRDRNITLYSNNSSSNREYMSQLGTNKYGKNYESIADYFMESYGKKARCEIPKNEVTQIVDYIWKGDKINFLKKYSELIAQKYNEALFYLRDERNTYYTCDVIWKLSNILQIIITNFFADKDETQYYDIFCNSLRSYHIDNSNDFLVPDLEPDIIMNYCTGTKMWSISNESATLVKLIDYLKKETEENFKWNIKENTETHDLDNDKNIKKWILEESAERNSRFKRKFKNANTIAKILIANHFVISRDEIFVTKAVYREVYIYKLHLKNENHLKTTVQQILDNEVTLDNDRQINIELLIRVVNRSLCRQLGKKEKYYKMLNLEKEYLTSIITFCENTVHYQDYAKKWLQYHIWLIDDLYKNFRDA